MTRNVAAGIALTATGFLPSCADASGPVEITPAPPTSSQTSTTSIYATTNAPVVPHNVSRAKQAVSAYGEFVLDNPGRDSEMLVSGDGPEECVATVVVSATKDETGKKEVSFTPGIATAPDGLDAVSMDASVHLDVDMGIPVTSTTIPESEIENTVVVTRAANSLLKTAKAGCEIFARDIAPQLGN